MYEWRQKCSISLVMSHVARHLPGFTTPVCYVILLSMSAHYVIIIVTQIQHHFHMISPLFQHNKSSPMSSKFTSGITSFHHLYEHNKSSSMACKVTNVSPLMSAHYIILKVMRIHQRYYVISPSMSPHKATVDVIKILNCCRVSLTSMSRINSSQLITNVSGS